MRWYHSGFAQACFADSIPPFTERLNLVGVIQFSLLSYVDCLFLQLVSAPSELPDAVLLPLRDLLQVQPVHTRCAEAQWPHVPRSHVVIC